jgi:hypothetical protein
MPPGYAINVTLVMIVARREIPIAHPGTERLATKYASVVRCLREKYSPIVIIIAI